MRIGVTGANGFVGSHLVAALCAEGHTVRILARRSSRMQWLAGLDYSCIYGDLRNEAELEGFVTGLDILIHCAALTSGTRQELNEANTSGTASILRALRRSNPHLQRFVLISSQEVMGINPHKFLPIDESTPENPLTDYGRSKLRAENLVRAASDWLSWTILRPSPVYGPRDKDTFLFFQAAAARLKPVAFFPGRISLIYVGNLVQGIIQIMQAKDCRGQLYCLADNPVFSWTSLTRTIETATIRHRLILPLGKTLLFFVTAISSAWGLVSGARVIMNRQKYLMMTAPNLSVDSSKARQDFGYTEQTTASRALRLTWEWYRSAGWL